MPTIMERTEGTGVGLLKINLQSDDNLSITNQNHHFKVGTRSRKPALQYQRKSPQANQAKASSIKLI